MVGLGASSAWAGMRYVVVMQVEGDPQTQEAEGSWRSLGPGMQLREGARIRTPSGASMVLALIDGNSKVGQLKVQEDSEMILSRMAWEPQTSKSSTLLDIAVGDVLLYVQTLEEDSSFEVRTPVSISGVRGTSFSVEHDRRSLSSETSVYEGIVAVQHLHPETGEPVGEKVVAQEGTRVRVEAEAGVRELTPLSAEEIGRTLKEIDKLKFIPVQKSKQPSRKPIIIMVKALEPSEVKALEPSDRKKGGALARFGFALLSAGLVLFGLWTLMQAVQSRSLIGFLLALAMIAGGARIFQSHHLHELMNWDEFMRLAQAAWNEMKAYLQRHF